MRSRSRCVLALVAPTLLGALPALAQPDEPLPLTIPSPNHDYRVQLDPDPDSPNYFPLARGFDAMAALDNAGASSLGDPAGYHDGYVSLGFRAPYFTDDRDVFFYQCDSDECDNGKANPPWIRMPSQVYFDESEACIRVVLGHELFHHVEYAHIEASGITAGSCGSALGKTVCEGHARAMQDKIYTDLDQGAADCLEFDSEVDDYLEDTSQNLWSASYESALFWTYLMEQHGFETEEPILGADFIEGFWDLVELLGTGTGAYALTDILVDVYGGDLVQDFRAFILANVIKDLDLDGLSQSFLDRYTYRDDGAAVWTEVPFAASITAPASGAVVAPIVYPLWGANYYEVDTSACGAINGLRVQFTPLPVVSPWGGAVLPPLTIDTAIALQGSSPGQPAAYYLKTVTGPWQLNLIQGLDPYERLILGVSSLWPGTANGVLTVVCDTSPLDIVALGGNPDGFWLGPQGDDGLHALDVALAQGGAGSGRGLVGIDPTRFEVEVGGVAALVVSAIERGDGYRLYLKQPAGLTAGRYDLVVRYQGIATTILDGIRVGPRSTNHLLLADTSSSMLLPDADSRLDALRDAGGAWVAHLPDGGGLGVVSFAGDDAETNDDAVVELALAPNDASQRSLASAAIAGLASGPDRTTSIGDALALAAAQADALGSFGDDHQVVLVSDGAEHEGAFWDDVEDDVLASGLVVHTVALGGWSDQGLLAEIAAATGGTYRFVGVPAGGASTVALADALAAIADHAAGRLRVLEDDVPVEEDEVPTEMIALDLRHSVSWAVAALWEGRGEIADVTLRAPDGSALVDGVDGARVELGATFAVFHLQSPPSGRYTLEARDQDGVPTSVRILVSASLDERLELSTSPEPENTTAAPGVFRVGEAIDVHAALLDGSGPLTGAAVMAQIAHPDGALDLLPLLDDGRKADRIAGDGIYSGRYDRATSGSPTGIPDDPTAPEQVGSYGIRAIAQLPSGASAPGVPTAIATAAVHVAPTALPDGDGDDLPPAYEARHPCLDDSTDDGHDDSDGDGVTNLAELGAGLDPCDPDSDGSGENDGSELRRGGDPADPADDALRRPAMLTVERSRSEHEEEPPLPAFANVLRYDAYPEHAALEVWRSVGSGEPQLVDVIDPGTSAGVWVDSGLTPGETHTYQVVALDEDDNESAPSPRVGVEAKADPEAPIAALRLDRGAPRTDDETVRATLALHFDEPARTEYRIWSLDQPRPTGWLPYTEEIELPIGPATTQRTVRVRAQLRDAAGNESPIVSDSIEQHPAGSLGGIAGTVTVAGEPVRAFVEIVSSPFELATTTGADGGFLLDHLLPGSYDLEISVFGYPPTFVGGIAVAVGDVTDVGVQALSCPSEQTFAGIAIRGSQVLRAQERVTLGGNFAVEGGEVEVRAAQSIAVVAPAAFAGSVRFRIVADPCTPP